MTRPPIAALKLSLLLVLATLLLAGVGIVWSRGKAHEAHDVLAKQQAAHVQAQQALTRSRDQQRLIQTHLNEYQALAARGFVGPEMRLAWIEAAQLANQAAGLYGLEYRLAPRVAAAPDLAQGIPLGQTALSISMPLLVESDLPRFLAALKTHAPGVYRVQDCRLSHVGREAFEAVNLPRLRGECTLLWHNVTPPQGTAPMRNGSLHSTGRFALATALTIAAMGASAASANDLGRLFYTPAERAQLEQARMRHAAPRTTGMRTDPPAALRYDGMVIRSDGRSTHWVDGHAQAHPAEAVGLKPGQTRADGQVFEPYQVFRPAPVTPPPAPTTQNPSGKESPP